MLSSELVWTLYKDAPMVSLRNSCIKHILLDRDSRTDPEPRWRDYISQDHLEISQEELESMAGNREV